MKKMENKQLHTTCPSWRGYSLDELRYARMIALTRAEIEKAKLFDAAEHTRDNLPIVGSASSFSSVFRSISKIEYFIIAFKLFRRLAPLFKKKS